MIDSTLEQDMVRSIEVSKQAIKHLEVQLAEKDIIIQQAKDEILNSKSYKLGKVLCLGSR